MLCEKSKYNFEIYYLIYYLSDKNRSMNLLDLKNYIKVFMISQNINLLLGSQQSYNFLKKSKAQYLIKMVNIQNNT